MIKIIGFVILITSNGSGKTIPANYDEVTGSQTGVIESYEQCRSIASGIYEKSGRGVVAYCVPFLAKAGGQL